MKRDLILVIDMQNAYGQGGVWCCPNAKKAADNISRIISEKRNDADVVFTRFLAPKEPSGTWEAYNRVNASVNSDAYANEIMDEFLNEVKSFPVYQKSTYSSLQIPEVRTLAKKARRVILTGVVAECCVLATAFALIDAGIDVVYLTDAVAGIDDQTEEASKKVLEGLTPTQVNLMTTDEYLKRMGKGEENGKHF